EVPRGVAVKVRDGDGSVRASGFEDALDIRTARPDPLIRASRRPRSERALLSRAAVCFNGPMAGFRKYAATGRHDLEPFWPSRQHDDFDRVCCRATIAPAR
ncbi:hypothetical protein, partial [Streptomyces olivaceus]